MRTHAAPHAEGFRRLLDQHAEAIAHGGAIEAYGDEIRTRTEAARDAGLRQAAQVARSAFEHASTVKASAENPPKSAGPRVEETSATNT